MQRLILCEIADRKFSPTSAYPPPDTPLPCDLINLETIDIEGLDSPIVSEIRAGYAPAFGRQAQAVRFLDHILDASKSFPVDRQLAGLQNIDQQIQAFLTLLIGESDLTQDRRCGAIATTAR